MAGQSPEEGFDGKSIQSFYAGLLARDIGGSIRVSIHEETTVLSAVLPVQAIQNAA